MIYEYEIKIDSRLGANAVEERIRNRERELREVASAFKGTVSNSERFACGPAVAQIFTIDLPETTDRAVFLLSVEGL